MKSQILNLGALFVLSSPLAALPIDSADLQPKDLKMVFDAKTVDKVCKDSPKKLKDRLKKLSATKVESANFENSVKALEDILADFNAELDPVVFMKYVSTDKKARDAAARCEIKSSELLIDVFSDEDLFRLVNHAFEDQKGLEPVQKLLLEDYHKSFIENGLALPKDKRAVFLKKQKEITKLENDYQSNLINWKQHYEASADELKGMPESYISALEKLKNGKYKITTVYPHIFGILDDSPNPDLRRKILVMYNQRGGKKNVQILEKTLALKDEAAKMLGFPNHAALALSKKMAKDPRTVDEFLATLRMKLVPLGKKELEVLVDLMRKDTGNKSIENLNGWDYRYYDSLLKKQKYQVDQNALKEYFPIDKVIEGMFGIYQGLLGVSFVDVTKDATVWHKSVRAYQVVDNKSKKILSYFFMDLYPRDGKYTHAAAFPHASGRELANGGYRQPVSSIVANFTPPAADRPALLLHDEVETLFHEFGHIMHNSLTTAKYASQAGTNTKWDYVEAPSQMLENWVWRKDTLAKMSGYYKDPKKPLPDDMIASLIASRNVNSGLQTLRQINLATIDMTYHTNAKVNTTEVWAKSTKDITFIPLTPDTYPQASFGHIMSNYDAGYYGYLWSKVFAEDMASRFEKEGFLNAKTGADYRKWILEPGGSVDPSVLIEKFLGRKPNQEAFLKSVGL